MNSFDTRADDYQRSTNTTKELIDTLYSGKFIDSKAIWFEDILFAWDQLNYLPSINVSVANRLGVLLDSGIDIEVSLYYKLLTIFKRTSHRIEQLGLIPDYTRDQFRKLLNDNDVHYTDDFETLYNDRLTVFSDIVSRQDGT